jgi:hypothetical protein
MEIAPSQREVGRGPAGFALDSGQGSFAWEDALPTKRPFVATVSRSASRSCSTNKQSHLQGLALNLSADTFKDETSPSLVVSMKHIFLRIRPFWEGISKANAIFVGIALGLTLGVVPNVVFGWPIMVPGFLVYFPFHVWLTYSLFSVLLSKGRRSRILGEGYSFMGALFGYLLTIKYSLFCISWFFTMWLYWVSIIGI